MDRFATVFLTLVFLLFIVQEKALCQESDVSLDSLESMLPLPPGLSLLEETLAGILEDPETLNKVLDTYLRSDYGWKVLKELHLQFKTFHADSATALGFGYSFQKDISKRYFTENTVDRIGQSISVSATGNVAFRRMINPQDFLNADVSVHIFGSHGGVVKVTDEVKDKLNALEDELVLIEDQETLNASPVWKEFFGIVQKNMTTQTYWDIAAVGALESDQSFRTKQYVYGLDAGLDVKAWNRNTVLASVNVFDWPFAAIRWLSGYDNEFIPRGSTIPTLLLGIKQVAPVSGDPRSLVGDGSNYGRLNVEVSFKTPIGSDANFAANFRYFKELGASQGVKAANLDEQVFFTSALTLSNGLFASYSTGRLPFDARDDQIYELGFQFSF